MALDLDKLKERMRTDPEFMVRYEAPRLAVALVQGFLLQEGLVKSPPARPRQGPKNWKPLPPRGMSLDTIREMVASAFKLGRHHESA